MTLKALLNQLKTNHKITSAAELAALLAQDAALVQLIKLADAQYWVNFSKQTFDGWYCVDTPSNACYIVAYLS